jgi:Ice-binding-like/PEP-CTERM motif
MLMSILKSSSIFHYVDFKRTGILVGIIAASVGAQAQTRAAITLGGAETFAVLGGSTVTSTGPSLIVGDVGVSPGTAITGFPPASVTNGGIHANDSTAVTAHNDAMTAYLALAALPVIPANVLTGRDLGGLTLAPGVYSFSTAAQLTGTLTLDAQGQTNPQFVFQIGTTLTTASAAAVLEINGGNIDNIFFQVGTSATLGLGTAFIGTIIASASDTLTTGVSLNGRAIALNGGVTLDTNAVTDPSAAPEPASLGLLGAGLAALVARKRMRPAN